METETKLGNCNICNLKLSGGSEESCVDHYGILPYLQNSKPEFEEYKQFLMNQKRKEIGLIPIELSPRSKKFNE